MDKAIDNFNLTYRIFPPMKHKTHTITMKIQDQSKIEKCRSGFRPGLDTLIADVEKRCIDCPKCRAECAFLDKYGTPRAIASNYDPSENRWLTLAYECSLCGLCGRVCPVGLKPEKMFLEMRRAAVDRNAAPLPEHGVLLSYERRGTSGRFSYYSLPQECRAVFFPGCTLSGTRPQQTIAIYEHLKQTDPALGVVLDCCCKPSHDLGRWEYFSAMMDEMKKFLAEHGIKTVITACPNCYTVLKQYGEPLQVVSVYELLVQNGLPDTGRIDGEMVVSIHDPCVTRSREDIHQSVRKLAETKGFSVVEMLHARGNTLCCGEGGCVGAISPELADTWSDRRREEAAGRVLLTYCAGCADKLHKKSPVFHILDAVLNPDAIVAGKARVSGSPLTYLNRLRLKRYFKKNVPGEVTRERTFSADASSSPKALKRVLFLLLLAAVIGALNLTGGTILPDQAGLRQWVAAWGVFAPIVYMLIYTVAPVLLLPGLPITIAGGILFGPFWGVVYTIIGATSGACASFLVARYAAGDLIRQRLISPRWKKLDEGVARHGWKIVAFTRLIPVFPFNLLNYAFGLTAIPFSHYAVTSFVCMLPACIAFIVFSSSLPDLIRGRISPAFAAGLVLIIGVMALPVIYRYVRSRRK